MRVQPIPRNELYAQGPRHDLLNQERSSDFAKRVLQMEVKIEYTVDSSNIPNTANGRENKPARQQSAKTSGL